MRLQTALSIAAATALLPSVAFATNGYFSHGYGTINKGMAGAGTALSQDSIAAATGQLREQSQRICDSALRL